MKIDRLLGITIYLLNHGRTPARALAKRFEVSTRTIVRDIEALGLAGIPVTSAHGPDGGYDILDTFRMERQIAGQTDYAYIAAALQGLATACGGTEVEALLEKMRACRAEAAPLMLDLGAARENAGVEQKLRVLREAIRLRRVVEFAYTAAGGDGQNRRVEPVAAMYKWYGWYLLAWSPERQAYRAFKLARMGEVRITGAENSRVHDGERALQAWESAPDRRKVLCVRLRCAPELRPRCDEYLNGAVEAQLEGGGFIYRFEAPEGEQFWYGVVLSFGSRATVLEPASLAERIQADCRSILQSYAPAGRQTPDAAR